jgi:hypothetical protein
MVSDVTCTACACNDTVHVRGSVWGFDDYGPLRGYALYSGRMSLFQIVRVKDGGRKFLQNVGKLAPQHTVSYPN